MFNFWLNCFPLEANSGPAKVFSTYVNNLWIFLSGDFSAIA